MKTILINNSSAIFAEPEMLALALETTNHWDRDAVIWASDRLPSGWLEWVVEIKRPEAENSRSYTIHLIQRTSGGEIERHS